MLVSSITNLPCNDLTMGIVLIFFSWVHTLYAHSLSFVMFLYTLYWCDINMTNSLFHYDDEINANFDIYFKYI
jgi:hypothetical protein